MPWPLARIGGDITIVSSYTRQTPRSPAGLPASRPAVQSTGTALPMSQAASTDAGTYCLGAGAMKVTLAAVMSRTLG